MPCAFARPASYHSAVNNFESLRNKCRVRSHDQLPIMLAPLVVVLRVSMPCAFARHASYHLRIALPTVTAPHAAFARPTSYHSAAVKIMGVFEMNAVRIP